VRLEEGRVAEGYDVSPDGRRFLTIRSGTAGASVGPEIILAQNWFAELKRLVPGK
jgi:hypothetical protein